MRKLWLVIPTVVLAVSACGGGDDGSSDQEPSSAQSSSSSSSEGSAEAGAASADLEGVPDVVAEVNGEDIGKEAFTRAYEAQLQQATAQSQGQDVDTEALKQQVADSLIGTELLRQEAEERGFTASSEDVDQTLTELAQQNGLKSADQFIAALGDQGMSQESVEQQVSDQVLIDQLVADEAGGSEPSDAEVKKYYEQLVAQQGQAGSSKIPPLAKVRPQLVEQLKTQQQGQVAQQLVTSLREDADVTVNL